MIAASTLMFAEASEAGAAVARQRLANRDKLLAAVAWLQAYPPSAVITCARGSSDAAATYAKYLIETRLGLLVSSASPSVSSLYGALPDASRMLCIAISQSGRSPDLIASATSAKAAGARLLTLINAPGSPLELIADIPLSLDAGVETSVAATKSFIASLAAIADLVATWSDDAEFSAALDSLPTLLDRAWSLDWSAMVDQLADARGLFVIGRGVGLAVAQEAALKLKETCGLHAEAFSSAEVRHGPMALIGPDFPLLVFSQADETAAGIDELVAFAIDRGAPVLLAGGACQRSTKLPTISAHSAIEPILQISSFYRAANALSLRRGLNPDVPPNLRKVTETV